MTQLTRHLTLAQMAISYKDAIKKEGLWDLGFWVGQVGPKHLAAAEVTSLWRRTRTGCKGLRACWTWRS